MILSLCKYGNRETMIQLRKVISNVIPNNIYKIRLTMKRNIRACAYHHPCSMIEENHILCETD